MHTVWVVVIVILVGILILAGFLWIYNNAAADVYAYRPRRAHCRRRYRGRLRGDGDIRDERDEDDVAARLAAGRGGGSIEEVELAAFESTGTWPQSVAGMRAVSSAAAACVANGRRRTLRNGNGNGNGNGRLNGHSNGFNGRSSLTEGTIRSNNVLASRVMSAPIGTVAVPVETAAAPVLDGRRQRALNRAVEGQASRVLAARTPCPSSALMTARQAVVNRSLKRSESLIFTPGQPYGGSGPVTVIQPTLARSSPSSEKP